MKSCGDNHVILKTILLHVLWKMSVHEMCVDSILKSSMQSSLSF